MPPIHPQAHRLQLKNDWLNIFVFIIKIVDLNHVSNITFPDLSHNRPTLVIFPSQYKLQHWQQEKGDDETSLSNILNTVELQLD